jgi:hypothetical protein
MSPSTAILKDHLSHVLHLQPGLRLPWSLLPPNSREEAQPAAWKREFFEALEFELRTPHLLDRRSYHMHHSIILELRILMPHPTATLGTQLPLAAAFSVLLE